MIRTTLIAVGLLLTAQPALAQDAFDLDPAHTQVTFAVDRFGFTTIFGTFTEVEGTVMLDTENPENSSVTASVGTASVWAGDDTRTSHLAGAYWLNAGENPQLTFVSTGVEVTGEDTARVTGDLTVFGMTRPATFDVTLNQLGTDPATQRQAAGFTLTTTIDRTAWGNETAGAIIGHEVAIRIEALGHLRGEAE